MKRDAGVSRAVAEAGADGRRWIERHDYVVATTSAAPPEAVYDVLADLESHVEWSGRLLGDRAERLLAIEAPSGPAVVGTEFRSTGYTPIGSFVDRSRVVVAERPSRFEFVTESRLERQNGSAMRSTWVHRFAIEPEANGSRIVRTDRQTRFYTPAYAPAHRRPERASPPFLTAAANPGVAPLSGAGRAGPGQHRHAEAAAASARAASRSSSALSC